MPETLRHNFAVWPLKLSGNNGAIAASKTATHVYYCLRCRWKFAVRGRLVAALDEADRPLSGSESLRRVATFANGPCPSLLSTAAPFQR